MSTENVEVFNRYYGNGVATQFSIGFPYLKREFVKVYLYKKDTDEEKVLNSDQFSFVNDATIQYPVLPTDEILKEGDILTIQRETELGSEFEFDNQRRLFPVEVMNADDLAFQQIQELSREIKRAVRVNPTAAETPEELLNEVYGKLDSASEIANEAIIAAGQATVAAEQATAAVEEAQKQIIQTQEYIDEKRAEVDAIVAEAEASVDDAITQATEDVKQAALDAANEAINDAAATATGIVVEYANNEIKPLLNEIASNAAESAENASESAGLAANESGNAAISATDSQHYAEDSRIWAEGEQAEVQELGGELSSKGWALQASNSATSASQSATQAKTSETNAKSYAETLQNLLPNQSDNAGKYLTTDGTNPSWAEVDLTNKANIDADNLSANGKRLISGLGMPSEKYVDLTLGSSSAGYTAPANGYFSIFKKATAASQYINMQSFFGDSISHLNTASFAPGSGYEVGGFMPVRKGDRVHISYTAAGAVSYFRFVYAEGDK